MSLPPIRPADGSAPGAPAEPGVPRRDPQHYHRLGTLNLPSPPPLGVYVHLPWCLRKCPYCDFNSHEVLRPAGDTAAAGPDGHGEVPALGAARQALPEALYLQALRADLEASLPLIWGRTVHTVFIGGGTPSLFSPESIAQLVSDLRLLLPLAPDAEITMEANPGTFERERFAAFAQAGITRLSIGVQSFNDRHLAAIGRVHDRGQAIAAAEEAARSFGTFNLDLMYALPQQTPEELEADLAQALALQPPHLSLYHLTLEPNTAFARRPPVLPDEDTAFDMLDHLIARTTGAGFERYEVSAFAKPGHRCRHNLNYWGFGDYLGIGAGAHGKLSFAHRVLRQVRWRDPQTYLRQALDGHAVSNEHEVARKALPFEFMLNLLRLREGFPLALFTERCGMPASALAPGLAAAQGKGLLTVEGASGSEWVQPTARGFDFLSDLQEMFL